MQVRLTQDIKENGAIKVSKRGTRPATVYEKGAVVDMSESSGQKYINDGKAVAHVDDSAAE